MKFLILGDTHAHLKIINTIIDEHPEVDAVLQCGDFGIWNVEDFDRWNYIIDPKKHHYVFNTMAPFSDVVEGYLTFNRIVIFITGNHENFDYRDSIDWIKIMNERNVIWLQQNELFDLGEPKNKRINIYGLNGCYSYKVYTGDYQKRKKIKVKPETPPYIEEYLNQVMGRDPRGRFTKKDVDKLKKQKSDILLLHEVPMGLFNSGDLPIKQKPGCSPINELIEKMQPRFAFCGHFHKYGKMKIGKTKVISLPEALKGCGILDTKDWSFKFYKRGEKHVR